MDIGKLSEETICRHCIGKFFPEFVYYSPHFYSPNEKNRELIDALLWFDKTLILIESKAQVGDQLSEKWVRKALIKANRQLEGAVKTLERNKEFLVVNLFGTKNNLNLQRDINKIIPIVVLNIDKPPEDLWHLQLEYRADKQSALVFTLREFLDALYEFDTAPDFIGFLMTVEALTSTKFQASFRDGFFVNLCREYGLYLSNFPKESLSSSPQILSFPDLTVSEILKKYNEKRSIFHNSYLIDTIIDGCREVYHDEIDTLDFIGRGASPYHYRDIVLILSHFNREKRNEIAEKMINCQQKLYSVKQPSLFSVLSLKQGYGLTIRTDFSTDLERQKILIATMVKRQSLNHLNKFLGIEALYKGEKITFNFFISEIDNQNLSRLKPFTEFMETGGSASNLLNNLCPCGSGRKFKKCCYRK